MLGLELLLFHLVSDFHSESDRVEIPLDGDQYEADVRVECELMIRYTRRDI